MLDAAFTHMRHLIPISGTHVEGFGDKVLLEGRFEELSDLSWEYDVMRNTKPLTYSLWLAVETSCGGRGIPRIPQVFAISVKPIRVVK